MGYPGLTEALRQSNAILGKMIAIQHQYMILRRPPENLGIIGRSAYDVDGTAADAVEGRNGTLQFYRLRPPADPRFAPLRTQSYK